KRGALGVDVGRAGGALAEEDHLLGVEPAPADVHELVVPQAAAGSDRDARRSRGGRRSAGHEQRAGDEARRKQRPGEKTGQGHGRLRRAISVTSGPATSTSSRTSASRSGESDALTAADASLMPCFSTAACCTLESGVIDTLALGSRDEVTVVLPEALAGVLVLPVVLPPECVVVVEVVVVLPPPLPPEPADGWTCPLLPPPCTPEVPVWCPPP